MPKEDRLEGGRRSRNWTNILVFAVAPLVAAAMIILAASPAKAAPPIAYSLYCLRHVAECPAVGPRVVRLTPAVRATIERIQRQVNAEIIPRREALDVWSSDVRVGDCDDFVMTKRRRLIKAGIPPTAMGISVFKVHGVNHVTLLVHTTGGIFELDNLRRDVLVRRRF